MNIRYTQMAIEIDKVRTILASCAPFINKFKLREDGNIEAELKNLLENFGILQVNLLLKKEEAVIVQDFKCCKEIQRKIRNDLIDPLYNAREKMSSFPESYLNDMTESIKKIDRLFSSVVREPSDEISSFSSSLNSFVKEYIAIIVDIEKDIYAVNERNFFGNKKYEEITNKSVAEMMLAINEACDEEREAKRPQHKIETTLQQLEFSSDKTALKQAYLAVHKFKFKELPIKWKRKNSDLNPELIGQLEGLNNTIMEVLADESQEKWNAAINSMKVLPHFVRNNLHCYESLVDLKLLHRAIIRNESFRCARIHGGPVIKEKKEFKRPD